MGRLISKIYHWAVNINQFYTYGRTWVAIPIVALTSAGSFGVLIIYLGIPQTVELLLGLTLTVVIGTTLGGCILFRKKGQQVDRIMENWRNPVYFTLVLGIYSGMIELFKKSNVDIPPMLAKAGIKEWDDLNWIISYVMSKGEKAFALDICKKMLEQREASRDN